jgi:hypothetical protein
MPHCRHDRRYHHVSRPCAIDTPAVPSDVDWAGLVRCAPRRVRAPSPPRSQESEANATDSVADAVGSKRHSCHRYSPMLRSNTSIGQTSRLLVAGLANLFVIVDGIIFYRSTFNTHAGRIDVCSGTTYQGDIDMLALVSLVIGLPLGIFATVFGILNRSRRQVVIAVVAIILSATPFSIGEFINRQILTHRASAFTTEGCRPQVE